MKHFFEFGKGLSTVAFLLLSGLLSAQSVETVVTGKVTDANSGDPIPFVNVVFKGTTIGTTTDFEGKFTLKTHAGTDSLVASYIGYKPRTKYVKKGTRQVVNFQLEENVVSLSEVVVMSGENPAWEILRRTVKNKEENDKRRLTAYEYDTYTKIEIDVDNISDEFRQRKVMQKITRVMDSVERMAGEDGKPILPVLITESISKLYYRDNPSLKKEHILKSKINGVGVEDGTTVTQMIGSSFQEYNFYQNWLEILTKNFVSPIADGWRLYYEYDLTDSLMIGQDFCYRLDFFPKSPQDLAFSGTIWITKADYALKQVDVTVGKQANLNFIEKIKIQQELVKTDAGAWLPVKNRVLVDVGEISKNSAGMLAKFYTSNKNIKTNAPYPVEFYERPIVVAEDARLDENEKNWDSLRHEPLTETEKSVSKMIDTLRNIPVIKTYTETIRTFLYGYYKAGRTYEVGPVLGLMAWNNIEGLRVQGGFKTNLTFSKKWVLMGTAAYGFHDTRVKYMLSAQRILSKAKWTTLTFRAKSDLARIGVDEESLPDNPIFVAGTRWGFFRRGYYSNDYKVTFQREFFKGFSQKIAFRNWSFDPTYNFGYLEDPTDINSAVLEEYKSSEVVLESRYARDEIFIQNDNERISLGTSRWPIFTLRYTHGMQGVLGSDFNYDKLRMSVKKRIRFGPLGYSYLTVTGENVFGTVPYPLLSVHLGNQTPIYSTVTYNLMNYGEFVSDHFVNVHYLHYFEGLFLNRIPLLKKLNWRLLGTVNVLSGGMRQANRDLISKYTIAGEETLPVGYLSDRKPYIELGYGVENIFRLLRIDFVHRLTYLNNTNARAFGVLFTIQFQF